MTSPTTQVYVLQDIVNGTSYLQVSGPWLFGSDGTSSYGGTGCGEPESPPSAFIYTIPDSTIPESMREIRLFGECNDETPFQVTINGGTPYNTSKSGVFSLGQFYQSPILSQGLNNLIITNAVNCCFDTIVAAPFPVTGLAGKTLLVDDTYEKIQYTGSWEANTNSYPSQDGFGIVPLMNTSRQTSTVGDTMRFAFSGTNAVVFGGKLLSQVGNFTVSFSIDDGSETTRTITTDGTGFYEPNLNLVDTGSIPYGDHTLTLNLTDCFNQTLIVDYITYTPNFNTLADMPNVTISSGSSQTTVPSASLSTTEPPTSLPTTASTNSTQNTSSSTTPIGAIVGGIIGGLALVISCIFIFWYLRRRHHLRTLGYRDPKHMDIAAGPPLNPYMLKPTLVSSAPVIKRVPVPTYQAGSDELTRRMDDLSRQVEILQSSVIPPAYGTQ